MFNKMSLLAAAGAGYVLGTRAGRGQYEKIATQAREIAEHPQVAKATTSLRHQVPDLAGAVRDKLSKTDHDPTPRDTAMTATRADSGSGPVSAAQRAAGAGEGAMKGALTTPDPARVAPAGAGPPGVPR